MSPQQISMEINPSEAVYDSISGVWTMGPKVDMHGCETEGLHQFGIQLEMAVKLKHCLDLVDGGHIEASQPTSSLP